MEKGIAVRVILAGSSGLIGTALAQCLRENGREVVRLVRRAPRAVDEVYWNAEMGELDRAELGVVDAVVHLGGSNIAAGRWSEKTKEQLRSSRLLSTAFLVETIEQMAHKPRVFVCASAVGIYGDRGDELLDEQSATGNGFLAELGVEWEAAAARASTRVVHPRFGVVLSREGGALAKMLWPFKLGLGGRLGNGRQYMSWVGLKDAVAALMLAIDDERLCGALNVVAPEPVPNAEFTRSLGLALGRPTLIPVPAFALRIALGQMADEALLASQRAIPEKLLDRGFSFADPHIGDALGRALS
ncbi:MAG: hypothetical protein ACI906_003334 [Candidatus Latescibacterota bacterium]